MQGQNSTVFSRKLENFVNSFWKEKSTKRRPEVLGQMSRNMAQSYTEGRIAQENVAQTPSICKGASKI